MRLPTKLNNPFALIGQGFVVGALLFFAFRPEAGEASAAAPGSNAAPSTGMLEVRR